MSSSTSSLDAYPRYCTRTRSDDERAGQRAPLFLQKLSGGSIGRDDRPFRSRKQAREYGMSAVERRKRTEMIRDEAASFARPADDARSSPPPSPHRFSRWRIARVTGRASFYRGDEGAIVPRVNVTKCYRLSDLGGVTPSAPSETIAPPCSSPLKEREACRRFSLIEYGSPFFFPICRRESR